MNILSSSACLYLSPKLLLDYKKGDKCRKFFTESQTKYCSFVFSHLLTAYKILIALFHEKKPRVCCIRIGAFRRLVNEAFSGLSGELASHSASLHCGIIFVTDETLHVGL